VAVDFFEPLSGPGFKKSLEEQKSATNDSSFFCWSISQASRLNSAEMIAKFGRVDSTKSRRYSAEFVNLGMDGRHQPNLCQIIPSWSSQLNQKPLLVSSGAHSSGMH
jgi:hypothetical protein